ncbi:MAG: putative 2OG-Fe(II) oxygenase [Bacteroidota bacterium]|nr:putative 2OG-Fe(II) oxygenase [Bacteroidota bacterium]
MRAPIFKYPSYRYEVDDWEFKKKGLLSRINEQKFIRTDLQKFETDRQTNNGVYIKYFQEFLQSTFLEFANEVQFNYSITDAWCVKYKKGDHQTIHNHRGWGFSGILYVEYDSEVHTPTCFMAPWQNPINDMTILSYPPFVKEGIIFITPSFTHHYVEPNESDKERIVIAFDLIPNN